MEEKEIVRQKVDMVQLVGEVVDLKRAGVNWKGLCPFHEERSPSFMVNEEMQIFKCFGCGESGDCFSWVMKREGVDFPEALKILADRVGVELKRQGTGEDRKRKRILEVLDESMRFYHFLLTRHEEGEKARVYLKNRDIPPEIWEQFMLGWAPEAWDGLVRTMQRRGVKVQELMDAGLVSKSSKGRYYDRFRGRVMFALRDVRGRVVGVAGRVIEKDSDAPKYINSPETEVYHKGKLLYGLELSKNAVRKKGRIVVVEGELDAISSWQAGLQEVVALKGTALTEDQVQLLKRYADQVILALDMDQAGDKAALRGIQMATKAGIEVRLVRLPEGKDPDDLARESPKLWQQLVDEALEVYDYWILSALSRFDPSTATGKREILEELGPLLSGIENPIVQSHWVTELARRMGIDERLVRQVVTQGPKSVRAMEKQLAVGQKLVPRRAYLEEVLVAVLWRSNKKGLFDNEVHSHLELSWSKQLVQVLSEAEDAAKVSHEDLPEEIRQRLGESLLYPEAGLNPGVVKELQLELKLYELRDRQKQLGEEIRRTESSEDLPTELMEKQVELVAKIRDIEEEIDALRENGGGFLARMRYS